MKIKPLMMGATLASWVALAAIAHGGATGIVKERMDGMGAMKEAVKVLTPMMQRQIAYDADEVRAQAAVIEGHAGAALAKLFPEGSGGAPSEARNAIWQDWDGFSVLAEQLRVTAEGLASAADNGLMMAGDEPVADMMGGGAMGQSTMMGGAAGMMDFAQMPADGAFAQLGQVCSACHTQFRAKK